MKKIINYFKKRQNKRVRTKIALNASYGVNDLGAVYGFVKNNTCPSKTKTDIVGGYIDGSIIV